MCTFIGGVASTFAGASPSSSTLMSVTVPAHIKQANSTNNVFLIVLYYDPVKPSTRIAQLRSICLVQYPCVSWMAAAERLL